MRIPLTRQRDNENVCVSRGEDGVSLPRITIISGLQSTGIHRHRSGPSQEGDIMNEIVLTPARQKRKTMET